MIYKNTKFSIYYFLCLLLLMPVSCIKDSYNQNQEKETRILDNYFKTHTDYVAMQEGYYLSKIEEGTGVTPAATDLVFIQYNARYLESLRMYDTSDSTEAAANFISESKLSTIEGPLKTSLFNTYGFYSLGVSNALLKMKEGGEADIVCPGDMALGSNIPFLFNVKLLKVITNPKQFELEQIAKYLSKSTINQTLADSVSFNHVNSLDTTGLWIFNNPVGTGEYPKKIGDTIDVKYTLKLLPVEDAKINIPLRVISSGTIHIILGTTELINGFNGAVRLIQNKGKASVIMPYRLGYGIVGSRNNAGKWVVPPYSTLIYDMEITSLNGK